MPRGVFQRHPRPRTEAERELARQGMERRRRLGIRIGRAPTFTWEEIACDWCKTPFRRKRYPDREPTIRFCGHRCASRSMWSRREVPKRELTCRQCGATFALRVTILERTPTAGQFCSRRCMWTSRRRRGERQCPTCGGTFAGRNLRFCSRGCWRRAGDACNVEGCTEPVHVGRNGRRPFGRRCYRHGRDRSNAYYRNARQTRPATEQRPCARCGVSFASSRRSHRFCSRACSYATWVAQRRGCGMLPAPELR